MPTLAVLPLDEVKRKEKDGGREEWLSIDAKALESC
jgi:hypothetical protein